MHAPVTGLTMTAVPSHKRRPVPPWLGFLVTLRATAYAFEALPFAGMSL
jgi:hypothetical protein